MSRKHFSKYFQKYYLFFSSAITILFLYACSTTKKVPEGDFLLTKNTFKFEDGKIHEDEIPSYVSQKPNKRLFGFLPMKDWAYNRVPAKYDSVFMDYYTFSNLISIAQQFIIQKYVIDEKKIHAKLQQNRNKPATPSKWAQKMEEMQKVQAEKMKNRSNTRKN